MDSAELTGRSGTPQAGVDCASCHKYVLQDSDHIFHLFRTSANYLVNGPITCQDCHATAIVSHPVLILDSIFVDSDGVEWRTLDFPVIPGNPTVADTLRSEFTRSRVDTLTVNRPLAAPPRAGPPPDSNLTEWMTGLAHMNGRVDVVFDPRVSDTARFKGPRAAWSPTQESCSAIACHPNGEKDWGFASPSKGLPSRKY